MCRLYPDLRRDPWRDLTGFKIKVSPFAPSSHAIPCSPGNVGRKFRAGASHENAAVTIVLESHCGQSTLIGKPMKGSRGLMLALVTIGLSEVKGSVISSAVHGAGSTLPYVAHA